MGNDSDSRNHPGGSPGNCGIALRPAILAAFLYLVLVQPLCAGSETLERGRALFEGRGSAATAVTAVVNGRPGNAAILRCSGCHGRDGEGRREADAIAPAIVLGEGGLDRIGITGEGALRPAYSVGSFHSALADGIGSDGRTLSGRMPRYAIDHDDTRALWSWLEALPSFQRQGVTSDRLLFAVADGQGGAAATALSAELTRAFRSTDPIYGRAFAFQVIDPQQQSCPGAGALALVLAGLADFEPLLETAVLCGVPVIVPFGSLIGTEQAHDVRSMSASLLWQWKALLDKAGTDAAILLAPDAPEWQARALRRAGMKPSDPAVLAKARHILVPFGLDHATDLPVGTTIYAPATLSIKAARKLSGSGNREALELSVSPVTTDGMPVASPDIVRMLRMLLQEAARFAGPQVTRARFIEGFDALRLTGERLPELDYRVVKLTGTQSVSVVRVAP